MELSKHKSKFKAVVLTADKFEDMEVFFPAFRILEEGWQIDIAASTIDEISGENGYDFNPGMTIDEVDPDDSQLLIIPGGFADGAPATIRKNKKAQEITKSFFQMNKPAASIIDGPWTLASAGIYA
jgi:protease I